MAKTNVVAACLLVALLSGPAAIAQEGGFVRVITTHIQLGHQQHLESLIPKLWDAFKKAGVKSPSFVSAGVSDPSAYTFVMPMATLGELAAQEEAIGKAFGSVPDLTGEIFGITTSVDDEIWAARPDLSYVPASPRLQMTEQGFGRIALLYAVPGQTQALEAALKERNALRKKYGITDGMDAAQLIIGRDGPVYALIIGAKDEVDFYTSNAKNTQKMGAEWQASLEKSGPMVRRVEFVTSAARPALSYQP
jgi:hypothetical protein